MSVSLPRRSPPTYEVRVECEFRASHAVDAAGGAATLHEHRWRTAMRAGSEQLDGIAIVVDFRRLRRLIEEQIAELEGTTLERHPELGDGRAHASDVADWLLGRLSTADLGAGVRVLGVAVTCDPGISYEALPRGEPAS